MKKYRVFLVIVMCILALQLCAEGFFSYCEQAKAEEELCRIKEPNTLKIMRGYFLIKTISQDYFQVLPAQCLGHCSVKPKLIYRKDFSIILAKLFNHSPPAIMC